MPTRVFISYSHADRQFARDFEARLEDANIAAFRDEKSIDYGSDIPAAVASGIREATHFVVLISSATIHSQWVSYEIGLARGMGIAVIPYVVEPQLDVPAFVASAKYVASRGDEAELIERLRSASDHSPRGQQRVRRAWEVIRNAAGKSGNLGRTGALRTLFELGESLEGIDCSGANLQELSLPFADLSGARFRGADLRSATLIQCNLGSADLRDANLAGADLRGASLASADLSGAHLVFANLEAAGLTAASLDGAYLAQSRLGSALLEHANLRAADLSEAGLQGSKLAAADFRGARLSGADLQDALDWERIVDIRFANIHEVKNAPEGFVTWALDCGAVEMADAAAWREWRDRRMVATGRRLDRDEEK